MIRVAALVFIHDAFGENSRMSKSFAGMARSYKNLLAQRGSRQNGNRP